MAYRIITYSKLTRGVAVITVPFIDDRGNPRYQVHQTLNSGCTIPCKQVYSLCRGVVVFIGNENLRSVTIQYDANTCITYSHLKSVEVALNQSVESESLIGEADGHVLVELLEPSGSSFMWPVRIGSYQYYKQDPEAYVSGDSTLLDTESSSYLSEVYPKTFDYRLLSPYVITLTDKSPQTISWSAMRNLRVAGAMLYAGRLFDTAHVRQPRFMSDKLPTWIEDIQAAGVLHGYYFLGRATNMNEAKDEIHELSYIIRNWPATLGVWVKPEFSRTVTTNNMILDTYRDALYELGLNGAIGLYTDKATMSKFSWSDKQQDWLLWLVDKCSFVSEFDTALTPDFFRLEAT